MAKVINQVLPGSDVSYVDSAGTTRYDADMARTVMPNAYPLPSDDEAGVTRRSARYKRPADQGMGSPEQTPRRMCFQQCAERWNALPDVCPVCPTDPVTSSKKNVWDAKQLQGVMCSYYDLYMGCCMKSCVEISVTIKGGDDITGGSISNEEDCFPCPKLTCPPTASILHTTHAMHINETQALSVSAPPSDCGYLPFRWELTGGGSLSSTTGTSVVYTAPSSNPNCHDNAVISLFCNDVLLATLGIAINTVTDTYPAIEIWDGITSSSECKLGSRGFPCMWVCAVANTERYDCSGNFFGPGASYSGGQGAEVGILFGDTCPPASNPSWCVDYAHTCQLNSGAEVAAASNLPKDLRTPAQIAAGCCPPEL